MRVVAVFSLAVNAMTLGAFITRGDVGPALVALVSVLATIFAVLVLK